MLNSFGQVRCITCFECLLDTEKGSNLQSRAANLCFLELDDVLRVPSDGSATLSMLDTALRRFVSLCASYHGQLRHDCITSFSCIQRFISVSRTVPSKSDATGTCMQSSA